MPIILEVVGRQEYEEAVELTLRAAEGSRDLDITLGIDKAAAFPPIGARFDLVPIGTLEKALDPVVDGRNSQEPA